MARSATYKHVVGANELSASLQALRSEIRANVLGSAMRRVLAPVLRSARKHAKKSERTGALRRSLTTKVVEYPASGKVVGLVGPDRGYYLGGSRITKTAASFKGADRPSKYAHLIEFGHHVVAPIKGTNRRKKTAQPAKSGTKWVEAKPFIRPAVLDTHNEQAAAWYDGVKAGFEKALAKATTGSRSRTEGPK